MHTLSMSGKRIICTLIFECNYRQKLPFKYSEYTYSAAGIKKNIDHTKVFQW